MCHSIKEQEEREEQLRSKISCRRHARTLGADVDEGQEQGQASGALEALPSAAAHPGISRFFKLDILGNMVKFSHTTPKLSAPKLLGVEASFWDSLTDVHSGLEVGQ